MLNSSKRHHGQKNSGYGARSLITVCALSALLAATGCYSVPPSTRESAALSDASRFSSIDPVEGARSSAPPTRTFRLPDRGEPDYSTSADYLADSSTPMTWPEAP